MSATPPSAPAASSSAMPDVTDKGAVSAGDDPQSSVDAAAATEQVNATGAANAAGAADAANAPDSAAQTNATTSNPAPSSPPVLSKNAQKRLRKRAEWEASAPERRLQAKERKKRQRENQRVRKQEEREERERERAENPDAAEATAAVVRPRRRKRVFGGSVVVDCAFDEGMTEKEIHSLAQQLSFCYASNRRTTAPFRSLIFTGPSPYSGLSPPGGSTSERAPNNSAVLDGYIAAMESASSALPFSASRTGKQLDKMGDKQWRRWKNVRIVEDGGLDALVNGAEGMDPSSMVYLTADTDETITSLDESKTYIIGGLVDRNRYKHVCLDRARSLGLQVARLPIDPANLTKKTAEGKHLSSRKVLTVNQVFDILVGWTEQFEGRQGKEPSWEEALERGLPGRKFAQRTEAGDDGGEKVEAGGDAGEEVEVKAEAEAEAATGADVEGEPSTAQIAAPKRPRSANGSEGEGEAKEPRVE